MSTTLTPHSADVQLWLESSVHGRLKLRRTAPTYVELSEPFDAPPFFANLIISIDGDERAMRVHVVSGLSRDNAFAMVLPVDNIAPF